MGKYFKYAIGEIILVVIGILIALQINNWNENRKNTFAEKEFLAGIKNDLLQDKDYINRIENSNIQKISAYSILNSNDYTSFNNIKERDSLLGVYFYVSQRTFYPVSGSYDSAIADNQINTFKNKEIIQKIIKLYSSTYSRLEDNGIMLDDRWNELSKKYSGERRKKSFKINDNDDFSIILDDIYYHYLQLNWYNNVMESTVSEIDDLLSILND